jgi:hypothetical protein
MKTKTELADFLREEVSRDAVVPHGEMIDIFDDIHLTAETVNRWLRSNGLNFEASFGQGTVMQWSFCRST